MSFQSSVSPANFEGDVVSRAVKQNATSAQEELARHMLLKEKLQSQKSADATEKAILGTLSEVEEVAVGILEDLNKYPESGPDSAYVASMTGTTNRLAQAMWIAEKIVAQKHAEMFISTYGGDRDAMNTRFVAKSEAGLKAREAKIGAMKARVENKASVAELIAAKARILAGLRA